MAIEYSIYCSKINDESIHKILNAISRITAIQKINERATQISLEKELGFDITYVQDYSKTIDYERQKNQYEFSSESLITIRFNKNLDYEFSKNNLVVLFSTMLNFIPKILVILHGSEILFYFEEKNLIISQSDFWNEKNLILLNTKYTFARFDY